MVALEAPTPTQDSKPTQNIARRISKIVPSKWFVDIHHFADCIGISVNEASRFIQCIEDGGYKSNVDGCLHPNPSPYDKKISLQGESDNVLNLHYIDNGSRVQSGAEKGSPAPISIEQTRRMIYIGSFSARNKAISVMNQQEMVKWVIGTHQIQCILSEAEGAKGGTAHTVFPNV
jgi:hypothetical protein